jgi:hypothetical protein
MGAELTSAGMAMSGSYFDDGLRDPRRYGVEAITGRSELVGRCSTRCDAVCAERIVGIPDKGPGNG